MKKKSILIFTIILATILISTSVLATTQASKKPKAEYVGYTFEGVFPPTTPDTITYRDTSNPQNIVLEGIHNNAIAASITIGDKTYFYPEDFSYRDSWRLEVNGITGEGTLRSEATLIFNVHGRPVLTEWIVTRVEGLIFGPEGTVSTPENVRYEGSIQLSGSRLFSKVDGFALETGINIPLQQGDETIYTLKAKHFGFISNWPW